MSNWSILFSSALVCGAILSLVLTIIMVISGAIAADMWVGDYPPDIREKYGPMSARSARLRPYFAVLFFSVVLMIPMLGLAALDARIDTVPFIAAFAFASLAILTFNLYDLIVLDWIFFCTVQPRAMVLPGTEGMAAYRDYRFHFVGFLKGLGFCAGGGLLIAALWSGVQALTT